MTFHISNIALFLDNLADRALTELERLNSESRDTLVRIEKILSDLVNVAKLGFKEPTILSENEDGSHCVWDQLQHQLECEGLCTEFSVQYISPIKSLLTSLLQKYGLEDLFASDTSKALGSVKSKEDEFDGPANYPEATTSAMKSKKMMQIDFIVDDNDSKDNRQNTTNS